MHILGFAKAALALLGGSENLTKAVRDGTSNEEKGENGIAGIFSSIFGALALA